TARPGLFHLLPRARDRHTHLGDIWMAVLAFVEDWRELPRVDRHAHDVIARRHAGDVDPLAHQLLVIPVAPPRRDALVGAVVAAALAAVLVLERVFDTDALLGPGHHLLAVERPQLVNREVADVVVPMARM